MSPWWRGWSLGLGPPSASLHLGCQGEAPQSEVADDSFRGVEVFGLSCLGEAIDLVPARPDRLPVSPRHEGSARLVGHVGENVVQLVVRAYGYSLVMKVEARCPSLVALGVLACS